jgi:hypothetical protein
MSLLHIDTALANSNNKIDVNIVKNNNNPFDIVYTFRVPRSNITSFTLCSAEIPIGFYNVRTPFNTFTVSNDSGTVLNSFTLPPGFYSTMDDVLNALNYECTPNLLFVYNGDVPSTIMVTNQLYPYDVILSTQANNQPNIIAMLGFDASNVCIFEQPFAGVAPWRITLDTYLSIYIPLIAGSSSEPSNITFKVPIDNGLTVTAPRTLNILYASATYYEQTIPNVTTASKFYNLPVQVYDRFGSLLDNHGVDWSFTLAIK